MKRKLLIMVTIIAVMSWILIPEISADSINSGSFDTEQINTDVEDILMDDEDDAEDMDEDDDDDDVNEDEDEDEDYDDDEDDDEDDENEQSAVEEAKEKLEAEKDILEEQQDLLEEQKDFLEEQYEEALENGNGQMAEQLLKQLEYVEYEIEINKQLIKEKQNEIKAVIKSAYTTEELQELEKLIEELRNANKDIEVMPIDSILAEGAIMKLDTPPVIKEGCTLIPVRALSESFGAKVDWQSAEKKIVISNESIEIVLRLNSNTAYVNGVEVPIEVPPVTINNRTVVPLRFITESMGLEVHWDNETRTIEINEKELKQEQ